MRTTFNPETARACALLTDDLDPVCVVVFDSWTKRGVEASIASDGTKRWAMSREYIGRTYDFVFNTAGRKRMTMATAIDNEPAIRMHKALGHVQEGVLRDWFEDGQAAAVFGFTKADYEMSNWHKYRNLGGDK